MQGKVGTFWIYLIYLRYIWWHRFETQAREVSGLALIKISPSKCYARAAKKQVATKNTLPPPLPLYIDKHHCHFMTSMWLVHYWIHTFYMIRPGGPADTRRWINVVSTLVQRRTRRYTNVGLTLVQRRRRWTNINSTSCFCLGVLVYWLRRMPVTVELAGSYPTLEISKIQYSMGSLHDSEVANSISDRHGSILRSDDSALWHALLWHGFLHIWWIDSIWLESKNVWLNLPKQSMVFPGALSLGRSFSHSMQRFLVI